MKNLIYSSALLCVFLFIASCKKDGTLSPVNITKTDQGTAKSFITTGCDTTKWVSYSITNSTGDASYEIAFSGTENYTFAFPANGSITIALKPGIYSISVYSPGNYSEHNISWGDQEPVKESGARLDNVKISACAAPQSVTIAQ
jgi:hypothetical protein